MDENHAAGQTIGSTGFRRIRHYGLFASSNRTKTMEAVRKLLNLAPTADERTSQTDPAQPLAHPCPCCGGRMIIIETFEAGCQPRPANYASRGNQDRYLMSVDTSSHTTARFPR